MANTSTELLDRRINEELERLGVKASNESPTAFVTILDDDLPDGWIRISDDYASARGPAVEILEFLEALEPRDDEVENYENVWEVLTAVELRSENEAVNA